MLLPVDPLLAEMSRRIPREIGAWSARTRKIPKCAQLLYQKQQVEDHFGRTPINLCRQDETQGELSFSLVTCKTFQQSWTKEGIPQIRAAARFGIDRADVDSAAAAVNRGRRTGIVSDFLKRANLRTR